MNGKDQQIIKKSLADMIFVFANYVFFTVIMLVVIYPLYYVVLASFSNPIAVLNGNITFWIKGFQLEGYRRIFSSGKIWLGYGNSMLYTVLGTAINILITMMAAYSLSRQTFKARKVIMLMMIFTMYFSGGLIPTYMVVDRLGLVGHWPVMIILGAVSVWNVIIARTFLAASLYVELQEAAKIDGCNDVHFLFRIVFPLSKALIAVLCLYYGLAHWNSYFTALIYLKEKAQYPLQLVLRDILLVNEVDLEMIVDVVGFEEQLRISAIMKYGLVIVASLPMLIIYPYLQKYFVKGVMLGSLKG
jgi:putative aldouronate transport system permease protein